MSFLSTTENVGFGGIQQNISDGSCATQYKMAVEGVSGSCGEVGIYINDSSGDEQPYITHLNDNFFHTKFKIDPNELYTFHDSDVVAGEITVSHTDDNYIFSDAELKPKLDSPSKDEELIGALTNGEVKQGNEEQDMQKPISNGHYAPVSKPVIKQKVVSLKDKISTKVAKAKSQIQTTKGIVRKGTATEVRKPSVNSPKDVNKGGKASIKNSITSVGSTTLPTTPKPAATTAKSSSVTFLDVFKREQGLVESPPSQTTVTYIKTEPTVPSVSAPIIKVPAPVKKTSAGKTTQAKPRKGRGPAVHEALQRIPVHKHAIPQSIAEWHAPGDELFSCGPLDGKQSIPFPLESSSDDDNMPDIQANIGPVCVEESAAESRSARLELRKAALRRQVMRADSTLRLKEDYRKPRELAALIKKQLSGKSPPSKLPTATINCLLSMRGMRSLLTSQERRKLRESGWSGGESGSTESSLALKCLEDKCTSTPVPCGRFCLSHVTLDPEQRLYAACAAVFAGGSRCMQPLLPLQDQTPLCAEHAWKRDNYDRLSRDGKPKKLPVPRKRAWPSTPRPPRKPKRKRRPPARPKPSPHQSLSEINVCSNSSTYDSSEDTTMGALSENEYLTAGSTHELEVEVGTVPADDILDPSVLSTIPDEAFTEFFNQAEATNTFVESSELAAALEALDERALDNIDYVFPSHHVAKTKMQLKPTLSMQSGAPS